MITLDKLQKQFPTGFLTGSYLWSSRFADIDFCIEAHMRCEVENFLHHNDVLFVDGVYYNSIITSSSSLENIHYPLNIIFVRDDERKHWAFATNQMTNTAFIENKEIRHSVFEAYRFISKTICAVQSCAIPQ